MKKIDWNNVQESGTSLPAGGYVCGITSVEDVPNKEYLKFEFDIAEGNFKNYYRNLSDNKGFWGGSFIKSYKDKALGFFKSMLICFEKSNKGFSFDYDEKVFKRKLIGLVLSLEEYTKNSGEIGTRLYVSDFKTVDDIRSGNFEVKPLKTLNNSSQAVSTSTAPADFEEIDDDDCPF